LILFSLGAAAMAGDVDAGASETLRNGRGGYGASRRSAVEAVFERVGALDVAGLLAEGERDAHHERCPSRQHGGARVSRPRQSPL
jgi:hypothetical protein